MTQMNLSNEEYNIIMELRAKRKPVVPMTDEDFKMYLLGLPMKAEEVTLNQINAKYDEWIARGLLKKKITVITDKEDIAYAKENG